MYVNAGLLLEGSEERVGEGKIHSGWLLFLRQGQEKWTLTGDFTCCCEDRKVQQLGIQLGLAKGISLVRTQCSLIQGVVMTFYSHIILGEARFVPSTLWLALCVCPFSLINRLATFCSSVGANFYCLKKSFKNQQTLKIRAFYFSWKHSR